MHKIDSKQIPISIHDWRLRAKSIKELNTAIGKFSMRPRWLTTKRVPTMPETVKTYTKFFDESSNLRRIPCLLNQQAKGILQLSNPSGRLEAEV